MDMPAVQTPLVSEEELSTALDETLEQDTPPSVRSMIANTGKTLKRFVDQMRRKETELEGVKAAATAEFERVVALAKMVRDNCHAETDADLHQIRTTLEVLDPARAKLSEMA
ncbi:hypothetical protein [Mesorhizobium sp. WSM3860]|uniref:hypothetical protein n=1 Tax=Mesorhizobium sp. WSM3860 TaxID=2029403 RepID=UPI000BB05E28|nr:hypothetical protein [Mesorhizobium sp. WSM3860]PBC01767.1 hypothetical protein CK220_24340 [Mesorhizobium sp. WSM3860]